MSDNPDINTLNLAEPEPEDWDEYPTATASSDPVVVPDKAVYCLVPTTEAAIKATREGNHLLIEFDAAIKGGPFDGAAVRFVGASAKVFERKGKKVSFLTDYFLSHGVAAPRTTPERIALAQKLASAQHPFYAQCDWEGRCKACGATVKGQEKFPKDAEGKRMSRIACPNGCKVTLDDGREVVKNIFANLKVRAFVPPPKPTVNVTEDDIPF